MNLINRIYAYVATDEGCTDIGRIELKGFTIISTEELALLQAGHNAHLIKALEAAANALITPQKTFKTKKAERAYYLVKEALGHTPSNIFKLGASE